MESENAESVITQSAVRRSSTDLLSWLGEHLPMEPCAWAVEDEYVCQIDEPSLFAHCDSCLMDEEIRITHSADISKLLHAQLESDEYRACYFELPPDERVVPNDWTPTTVDLAKHEDFCLRALNKRKVAIMARGEEPVAVGMRELLDRLRWTLEAGELGQGLSPRPCDWRPLFRWIRQFEEQLNELRRDFWQAGQEDHQWDDPPIGPCPSQPLLSAVLVRSTTNGTPVTIEGQAHLWSWKRGARLLLKPAASMMVEEDDEDEEKSTVQLSARSSGASSIAASSSAAPVSSLRADEESAARGAPRQRRS